MTFAKRTQWELAPNRITEMLTSLKQSGTKILDLTESNPTRCGFQYPEETLLWPLGEKQNLTYAPTAQGTQEARAAVAKYYAKKGISITPEQIILTASTSEAYAYVFRLLLDPGDEILAPRPSYPLLEFLSGLHDVQILAYPILYANDTWQIDFSAVRSAWTQKTKALILIHPNNPTGSFAKLHERKTLNEIAASKNGSLIVDEVFLDYALQEKTERAASFAGNRDVLTFALSGISKILGLPQMKIGWIVVSGPEKEKQAALERLDVIADTYLSVNTPAQTALPRWLTCQNMIQSEIKTRLMENLKFAAERCQNHGGIELLEPEGGWYVVFQLRKTQDEEALAMRLLRDHRVLAHPGYFFDFESGSCLVVSLLTQPEIFKEGVEKILSNL